MDIDDMELVNQRRHWQINERHLHTDDGIDSNSTYCEIGNEMLYEALNALLPIVIKYSHQITEESSKSEYVEDYLCPHICQVWLADHLHYAAKILVDYLGGYAIGMGDSKKAISQALGSGPNSSGNLEKVHPDMRRMRELIQEGLAAKNPLGCAIACMTFPDGFGGSIQIPVVNPQLEESPDGQYQIPLDSDGMHHHETN